MRRDKHLRFRVFFQRGLTFHYYLFAFINLYSVEILSLLNIALISINNNQGELTADFIYNTSYSINTE